MRREAKQYTAPTAARIQSYHEGGSWGDSEAYAYRGFKSNKYYTSDRFVKLDEHFRRPDNKPLRGFGTEIELQSFGIKTDRALAEVLEKIIFPNFPEDLFKMQSDSSLYSDSASSAECITQVMTREFIRNNYANFKKMFDVYFPAFGISCSKTGACGMHVNISLGCFGRDEKTQAECVRKLLYFVNKRFSFVCALTNRNEDRTRYCARMTQYAIKANAQSVDLTSFGSSHGVCFNLGHYNSGRIELRFVGGQKNFACFRNTMEAVFFLVEAMKRLSWDELDDLGAVFAGCNQYVYDRISTMCFERDTVSAADVARIREAVVREDLL